MNVVRPLAIDLFTGLHGWAEGFIAEGYRVVGYDIIDMSEIVGKPKPEHFELVIADVLTLHGAQFKDAEIIVASPPCQNYSYMAMPWSKAKAKGVAIRADETGKALEDLNRLFNACFRIQREASAAAGRYIPLVVENVRGAQAWVGKAKANFGSFYLWGDVPLIMPKAVKATKVPGFRFDGNGGSFQTAAVAEHVKVPSEEGRRTYTGKGARFTLRDCGIEGGIKQGGDWLNASQPSISRVYWSKSPQRKMASALIAKIPLTLSRHIASWAPLLQGYDL